MAQTGYTPIVLFRSGTTGNTPTTSNLAVGELAINYTDGKLFYNTGSAIKVIAGVGGLASGSTTQVQYNLSGVFAGSANFTFNGTNVTMANDASISGLTVGLGAGAVSTNTAVGASALQANTSGGQNVAVGYQAFYSNANSLGVSNVAVGWKAAYSYNGVGSNQAQVYIGASAGYYNVSGIDNTYVGGYAGYQQTGGYNTALGSGALLGASGASSGTNNVAVGYQALAANTSASNNTSIGYKSGVKTTSGTLNTFVGTESGTNNVSGIGNTFVGRTSGLLNTGSYNCFVGPSTAAGESSGYYMTTGDKNTILGGYNGNQGGVDIRTSTNNTVISNGTGTVNFYADGATNTAFFNGAYATANCNGTSIQSFNGNTTSSTINAWATIWTIPQGTVGLLSLSISYGGYGGGYLFYIVYGTNVLNSTGFAQLASAIGDQAGYNFAFRLSGANFQIQNNTNGATFVPRLTFIQMA
jgi:hypothetical protein